MVKFETAVATAVLGMQDNLSMSGCITLTAADSVDQCRTVLARALLAMQDSISMDVLFYQQHPDRGWQFKPEVQGCTADTANGGLQFIRELYEKHNSEEKSVPILFDKKTMTIVNNESADIVRMFATECQVRLSNHTLCC